MKLSKAFFFSNKNFIMQITQARHLIFELATRQIFEAETRPTFFEQTPVKPKKTIFSKKNFERRLKLL